MRQTPAKNARRFRWTPTPISFAMPRPPIGWKMVNIIQIGFLISHASLDTIMRYLDIITDDKRKAPATPEGKKEKKVTPKWKNSSGSLSDFCGLKP